MPWGQVWVPLKVVDHLEGEQLDKARRLASINTLIGNGGLALPSHGNAEAFIEDGMEYYRMQGDLWNRLYAEGKVEREDRESFAIDLFTGWVTVGGGPRMAMVGPDGEPVG